MAKAKHSKSDPRVSEAGKHLRILSKRLTRPVEESDYLLYKSNHSGKLPSVETLKTMFGTWEDVLTYYGIDPDAGSDDLSRFPDTILTQALQDAAADLETESLSTTSYDQWRDQKRASGETWHPAHPDPPSSSVIRKWLGYWEDCLVAAGLDGPKRPGTRRPTTIEIINALVEAKERANGMLSELAYQNVLKGMDDEERETFPTVDEIIDSFGEWDQALKAADIEQSDSLHPSGLWTAEECRRIARQAEILLGGPLTEEGYAYIQEKSHTPKPSWDVLQELLAR